MDIGKRGFVSLDVLIPYLNAFVKAVLVTEELLGRQKR